MYWSVFYITTAYFLLGAIGIFLINRKKGGAGERWKKFFIYALIVYGVENAIISVRPFPYLGAALMLVGANEIVFVWRWHPGRKWYVLLVAILLFAAISYGFYHFTKMGDESLMQLYIYLVVLTFDGFSQVFGQLLGRHTFVKKISPNKTIEGALGGFFMALCTAFLLRGFFNVDLVQLTLLTALMCVMALVGDLFASWYKRLNNVKDYSNLIPGHGGVLDRFD